MTREEKKVGRPEREESLKTAESVRRVFGAWKFKGDWTCVACGASQHFVREHTSRSLQSGVLRLRHKCSASPQMCKGMMSNIFKTMENTASVIFCLMASS